MNDGCNFVRKDKHLLLKRFGRICELTNIAEQKDALHRGTLGVQY